MNLFKEWRNQILTHSGFRHWAQKLPVFRTIARRRARDLFNITSGFVNSQVLAACLELDLLEQLAKGHQSVQALAEHNQLTPERMRRLLLAAESLALLERRGSSRYGLGPQGAVLLADPGLIALARHHRALYRDLVDPVGLLRDPNPRTELSKLWPYASHANQAELDTASVTDYTALMGASQQMVAEQVLQAFSFKGFSSLLDVGGGNGSFVACVARQYEQLELAVSDLPAVAPLAEKRLDELGLGGRTTVYAGNFHTDPLPEGQELISLVRIIHDHDDDPVRQLLASCFRALRPGGTLLLAEPMLGAPGAEHMGAAYFGFYLLAMGSGRARTVNELKNMLSEAGFEQINSHKTALPLICSVISARRQ